MAYFDAHLHVISDEVILSAVQKGVKYFFVNAAKYSDWPLVLSQSERLLGIYPCLGIHPFYLDTASVSWEQELSQLLEQNQKVMIGEIGLDGTRPDMERQCYFFERQMMLAQQFERPVHVHCYQAWPEMLQILARYPSVKVLMHRFSGDAVVVQKLRFFDVYFSIVNNKVLDVLPQYRILVESDADGGNFTPEYIPDLVQRLNLNPDELWHNLELFLDGR